MVLERKQIRRKEYKAAVKIQSMVRGHIVWKRYQKMKGQRLEAVLRIQRAWRNYVRKIVFPKIIRQIKD